MAHLIKSSIGFQRCDRYCPVQLTCIINTAQMNDTITSVSRTGIADARYGIHTDKHCASLPDVWKCMQISIGRQGIW